MFRIKLFSSRLLFIIQIVTSTIPLSFVIETYEKMVYVNYSFPTRLFQLMIVHIPSLIVLPTHYIPS